MEPMEGEVSDSLKLLHLMSCRGWSSDAYWAGRVVRELEARGHRVTFVGRAGTEEKVLGRLRDLGVRDLRTLGFGGRRAPLRTAADLRTLRRLLGGHDLAHAHRGREHWLAAAAGVGARPPAPLVRTRHIVAPVRPHALNRWLYARATAHVITVSRAIREQYLAAGLLPPERVTAVLGGVDHRAFSPSVDGGPFRRGLGLAEDARTVGIMAGLRPMKDHTTFLGAAKLVAARHPAVRFVVVGDGPAGPAVRARVAELGLAAVVVMTGFVPRPEAAVAAMDVAVYSSRSSEGMGRVLYEYMAMARPIAATAVGLAPEILADGETALLVPPSEPAALARAIEILLDDREFAARAGARCRRLVEEAYSGEAVARAVETVYRQVLARRRGRAA
jgi:glycosyltransferase involved in cell wall biosynthesis